MAGWGERTLSFISQVFIEGCFQPVNVLHAKDARINRGISEARSILKANHQGQCDPQQTDNNNGVGKVG